MKRTLLFLAATVLLLVLGCKKPRYCEHVSPYAPFEISWTDYNTLDSVREYFKCHDSTWMLHYNDSVKVKGYFVYRNDNFFFRNTITETDSANKWVRVYSRKKDCDTGRMAFATFKIDNYGIRTRFFYSTLPRKECCELPFALGHIISPIVYE